MAELESQLVKTLEQVDNTHLSLDEKSTLVSMLLGARTVVTLFEKIRDPNTLVVTLRLFISEKKFSNIPIQYYHQSVSTCEVEPQTEPSTWIHQISTNLLYPWINYLVPIVSSHDTIPPNQFAIQTVAVDKNEHSLANVFSTEVNLKLTLITPGFATGTVTLSYGPVSSPSVKEFKPLLSIINGKATAKLNWAGGNTSYKLKKMFEIHGKIEDGANVTEFTSDPFILICKSKYRNWAKNSKWNGPNEVAVENTQLLDMDQ